MDRSPGLSAKKRRYIVCKPQPVGATIGRPKTSDYNKTKTGGASPSPTTKYNTTRRGDSRIARKQTLIVYKGGRSVNRPYDQIL